MHLWLQPALADTPFVVPWHAIIKEHYFSFMAYIDTNSYDISRFIWLHDDFEVTNWRSTDAIKRMPSLRYLFCSIKKLINFARTSPKITPTARFSLDPPEKVSKVTSKAPIWQNDGTLYCSIFGIITDFSKKTIPILLLLTTVVIPNFEQSSRLPNFISKKNSNRPTGWTCGDRNKPSITMHSVYFVHCLWQKKFIQGY